jgi:hypothetical protein
MPILRDSAPVFFPKDNVKLSKYFDFLKFLSLLSSRSLFFCRLDKLEDQFEGMTAKQNLQLRINWHKKTNWNNLSEEQIKEQVNDMYAYDHKVKEFTCVCCWNKAENESAALWKIYSDLGKGIMIRTSVKNLIASLENTREQIRMSEIRYIDYEKQAMPDGNTMFPLIHKQLFYKYEEEVRLIYEVDFPQIGKKFEWENEPIMEGRLLKTNLAILIEEIVIGPYSPKWSKELLSDLLKKYELEIAITKSKLTLSN